MALLKPGKDPSVAKSSADLPALPHLQAVRTTHTESDSRTRGCETHSRTNRISSGKIVYVPATEPDGAHRRRLREAPDHRCCLRGLVCCLRHGQPPMSPKQCARDDWRRTPDRPDTHNARKQTILRGVEREEEPLAATTKRTTTGKCTGTDIVQYLHQRLARTRRYSQLHLRIANIEASLTSALGTMTTYYDTNQMRANPSKTQVCFPPKESRSQTRTECRGLVWNGTRLSKHNSTSVSGHPP